MTALDYCLMALYVLLMGTLTIYAVHAYLMMFLYFKNRSARRKRTREITDWPRVTVQLPVYNEQYVVERLIAAVCALDYPRDKLEIQVLDDSTDETRFIAQNKVGEYRSRGIDICHLHRVNRQGFKAGALKAGLEQARGEFLAIFDADFLPPPDFLKKLLPYFAADNIGLVQARWGHINGDYSLLTRAQAMALDAHFVLEHGARNASGIFINFNGTAGVWRKSAILDAGNWQDDTLTEDLDISYRAQLRGWKFVYINDVVCPAEVPAEVYGMKNQQYRWAKGAIQTAKKLLPLIWRNPAISRLGKFEATIHMTNHLIFPMLLFIALLSYPILLIRVNCREAGWFFLFASFFIINAFSYPLFYIYAQKEIYADWKRRMLVLPILFSAALGLSVVNTRAVFSALLGRKSAFLRTPKYNLTAPLAASWQGKKYRGRFDTTALFELALIVYISLSLSFAIRNGLYLAIPFILIYWFGFAFIGALSVAHAIKR